METIKVLKDDLFYVFDQMQGEREFIADNEQVYQLIEQVLTPDEMKDYSEWVKKHSELYHGRK